MPEQNGLEWVSTIFGLEPRWTREPDINIITRIARKHLSHSYDEVIPIDVTFHAQGGFNKLYKVSTAGSDCLMRVSLPVDPRNKTDSEVATIDFVRRETDMLVPRVIAFDSNNQNELGFEWILMEMMPGVTLTHGWRKLTWTAKETIVRQLVSYQAQLFAKRLQRIGNIFHSRNGMSTTLGDTQSWPESFVLGRIVSLVFFWGDHLTHDVPRGPFERDLEWLQARLQFVLTDQDRIIRTSDDEDDIEDAEFARNLAEDLRQVLPTVFPPDHAEVEASILFHDDLSMQNILVDKTGKLTAIIDWECVSAVPLWRACQLPKLLEGRHRDQKPERDDYGSDSASEGEEVASHGALDNEGLNGLYWEHLLEYEKTQLRRLFLDEMEKQCPEWAAQRKRGTLKADFEKAVHNCDNGWRFKTVKRWLKAFAEGNTQSLADKLLE